MKGDTPTWTLEQLRVFQQTGRQPISATLMEAQRSLGLLPEVIEQRPKGLPDPDPEPDPEPPKARTNASNDGRPFEDEIKCTAKEYERRKVLTLEKTVPGARIIGGGSDRKVIFMRSRHVDFEGAFTERGGRFIALECKSTAENRLPLGRPGGLTENQVRSLRDWTLAGGVTGLIWKCPAGVLFLPYRDIQALVLKQKKSLVPEDGKPVKAGDGFLVWDFAENLRLAYPRTAT